MQTQVNSIKEQITRIVINLLIVNLFLYPFGFHSSVSTNLIVSVISVVQSFTVGYLVRRVYNRKGGEKE